MYPSMYTFLLISLALSVLCAAHNKRFDLDKHAKRRREGR